MRFLVCFIVPDSLDNVTPRMKQYQWHSAQQNAGDACAQLLRRSQAYEEWEEPGTYARDEKSAIGTVLSRRGGAE